MPAELLPPGAPLPRGSERFPAELAPSYVAPVAHLLAEADRYYASADEGIAVLGFRSALAVRMARHVYAAIGTVVARQRHDVVAGRAVVGGGAKLVIMLRTIAATVAELPRRFGTSGQLSAPRDIVRFEDATLAA